MRLPSADSRVANSPEDQSSDADAKDSNAPSVLEVPRFWPYSGAQTTVNSTRL